MNMDSHGGGGDDDDETSVVSLPERLSHLYRHFFHFPSEDMSEVDDGSASAPSALVTIMRPEGFWDFSMLGSSATSKEHRVTPDTSSSSSTDESHLPPPPPSPPAGSDYTSFVKASPSPPHHRALNLCLTHSCSHDDVEPFYLRPPPPPHLALDIRTMASAISPPIPKEQGKEQTVNEYQELVDSFEKKRRISNLAMSQKDLTMQSDLMFDAPSGIMLAFDRMLDCIDPSGGNVGLREGCHDRNWQSSSSSPPHMPLFNGTTRLLDDDDQSISTIDSLMMELSGSSSVPSGVLDMDLPSTDSAENYQLAKFASSLEGDDMLCPFPCWDEEAAVMDQEGFKAKKMKPAKEHRPRGRSRTRRPASIPRDLELTEESTEAGGEVKNLSQSHHVTDNLTPTPALPNKKLVMTQEVYVSDESCEAAEDEHISVENHRKRNLSAIENEGEGHDDHDQEEGGGGDDDDDSLSKLLRGLDFEPPFDENDELYKVDRTLTTDEASTLSYSSFTY